MAPRNPHITDKTGARLNSLRKEDRDDAILLLRAEHIACGHDDPYPDIAAAIRKAKWREALSLMVWIAGLSTIAALSVLLIPLLSYIQDHL